MRMTLISEGQVATPMASAYLGRLCKHFAKKIPAVWNDWGGVAEFPFGRCELEADARMLRFRCAAPDDDAMARLQSVISDHVGMFTKRDPLRVRWTRAVPAAEEG